MYAVDKPGNGRFGLSFLVALEKGRTGWSIM
jgi:hypothetical protein